MRWLLPLLLLLFFWVSGGHVLRADSRSRVRWEAAYSEQYFSEADSNTVTFSVRTPPRIEGRDRYPLMVVLNGGPRVPPSEEFPYIRVQPTRNRSWGYRTMSAHDVMRVIGFMKRNYPIDEDRVYLVGSSAGGSGAMHLASCYPDQFAAVLPLIAAGNNYPLPNFTNLPVAFHHGDRDWVSAICNVRVQTQRLQALGCPAELHEYPGAGHGVPGSHEPMVRWLLQQKRVQTPSQIHLVCETPSLGKAYWLRITRFKDPHQRASIEARIEGRSLTVDTQNVAGFALQTESVGAIEQITIDEQPSALQKRYQWVDGKWWREIDRSAGKKEDAQPRHYEAGAAANLYQGEPLLIVYGTAGGNTDLLRAAAMKLAAYGGPPHTPVRGYRFPVVADKELTAEQQSRCNLILIGRPSENLISEELLPELPLAIRDQTLHVATRKPMPLAGRVLSLLHKHPKHPQRLVYLVAPFVARDELKSFGNRPQYFLAGSEAFDRVSQPDLIVQNLQNRVGRQMQLGHDWRWVLPDGEDQRIQPRFSDRVEQARACLRLMRSSSNADFALWWGPQDPGMWGVDFNHLQDYDRDWYTLADFRTQRRVVETTLGNVRGDGLKQIHRRWGEAHELLFELNVDPPRINDQAQYRLHMPMDMYIKLGQRKKNLIQPQAGPSFRMQQLIEAFFSND